MKRTELEQLQMAQAIANKAEVKYYAMLDTAHVHVSMKNNKIGHMWNLNLLPGSGYLTKRDGMQLTNIKGSCTNCESCEKFCYARKMALLHNNVCIPDYAENTLIARENLPRFEVEVYQSLLKYANNGGTIGRFHSSGEDLNVDYTEMKYRMGRRFKNRIRLYGYTTMFNFVDQVLNKVYKGNAYKMNSDFGTNISQKIDENGNRLYENPGHFHEFLVDDGSIDWIRKLPHCPAVGLKKNEEARYARKEKFFKYGYETGITCEQCGICRRAKRGTATAVYCH